MVSAADLDLLPVRPVRHGCRPPFELLPRSYTGRDAEELLNRRAADSDQRLHALTGPAGSGKTAIALGVAQALSRAGRCVYWLTARNKLSLLESLTALALEVGADPAQVTRHREQNRAAEIWDLIRNRPVPADSGRAVLVIDHANDADQCGVLLGEARRLPPQQWFVVITTQLDDLGAPAAVVYQTRIGPLSKAACSQLIIGSIDDVDGNNDLEAAEVAYRTGDLLGRLPLALHVAGSQQRSIVVRHTLKKYSEALIEEADANTVTLGPIRQVALAVGLGLKAINEQDRVAVAFVLSLLAAMAPAQPFPIDTLEVVGTAVAEGGLSPDEVEPLLRRGRRTLRDTGLIESGVEDDIQVLWIHPLVADAVRLLNDEDRVIVGGVLPGDAVPEHLAAHALDRATEDLAGRGTRAAVLSLWRLLIPHVQHLMTAGLPDLPSADPPGGATGGPAGGISSAHRAAFRAAGRTVLHLVQRGLLATAVELTDRLVELAGETADDEVRLAALLHRGIVRQALRLNNEALADIMQAIEGYRPRGATTEGLLAEYHLATLHHDKGELTVAKRLLTGVLDQRTDLLGPDHPDTLTTRHRLGMVIQAADAAAALAHFDAVFEARQRMLGGTEHPEVIAVMHSQAYARQAIGGPDSLQRAERDFTAVLQLRDRVLGPVHPNTLVTEHNLAWIDQAQGRYGTAENRFRRVLDVQLRRLDPDHPHPVATVANLAWDLLQRRQFDRASDLFRHVLYLRSTQLGHQHPDTQTTRGNIAWLTYEHGDPEEAAFRLRQLVVDREQHLEENHPRTLTTRHNLALSLRAQRDFPNAIAEFQKVLPLQRAKIGVAHPSTLATMYNLAVTYRLQADDESLEKAIRLLRRVLKRQRTLYSSRHPDLIRTRDELVATLRQRGTTIDLDHASDEQMPSRAAAALSRNHVEPQYDEQPVVTGTGNDTLIPTYIRLVDESVRPGIKRFIDPDIQHFRRRAPILEAS